MPDQPHTASVIYFPHAGSFGGEAMHLTRLVGAHTYVALLSSHNSTTDHDGSHLTGKELVKRVSGEILKKIGGGNFVLVGHSFGASFAYRVAEQLVRQGETRFSVVVSGARPPHAVKRKKWTIDSSIELQEFLRDTGSADQVSADESEERYLRDHLNTHLKFQREFCEMENTVISVTGHVIRSLNDHLMEESDSLAWFTYFSHRPTVHAIRPCGHFYMQQSPCEYASILNNILEQV